MAFEAKAWSDEEMAQIRARQEALCVERGWVPGSTAKWLSTLAERDRRIAYLTEQCSELGIDAMATRIEELEEKLRRELVVKEALWSELRSQTRNLQARIAELQGDEATAEHLRNLASESSPK